MTEFQKFFFCIVITLYKPLSHFIDSYLNKMGMLSMDMSIKDYFKRIALNKIFFILILFSFKEIELLKSTYDMFCFLIFLRDNKNISSRLNMVQAVFAVSYFNLILILYNAMISSLCISTHKDITKQSINHMKLPYQATSRMVLQ